jgi:D-serine deaminase-like pyridoxal phosphate-dependent protein
MHVTALDTPVVTIDMEVVERNIARMQGYCDTHGLDFRPHIKTHKLPLLAHMQVRAGAVGIACQKLGEAEVMAAAGLSDVLVTFPLVGAAKAERLATLAHGTRIAVVGDSATIARGLSETLARAGVRLDFLVECDTGFHRTGVQSPEHAADLAELVAGLEGLRFGGLMTYPTTPETAPWIAAAKRAIQARGLEVSRVSGGGTPTALYTHEIGEVTEIRAGVYIYGDRNCIVEGAMMVEDCALRVRATVVSRPTSGRAILDAGSKALTTDLTAGTQGFGLIDEYPDAIIYDLSEEHGHVDVSACARGPEVGEVVTILPNHACPVSNLYDEVVLQRAGMVVGILPVAARGKVR